jgi:hypothetical protein
MMSAGWWVLWAPALFTGLAWAGGDAAAVAVYVAFNAVVNLPHQYATWRRLAGERLLRPGWVVTGLVVAAGLMIVAVWAPATARDAILGDLFLYWGLYHLAAQHAGIHRIMCRRAGVTTHARWRDLTFFCGILTCAVLWLHATTALTAAAPWGDIALHRLPLEGMGATVAACAVIAAAIALVVWRRATAWRSAPASAVRYDQVMVVSTGIALASPSLLAAVAGVTAVHNLHYLELTASRRAATTPARRWGHGVLLAVYLGAVHAVFAVSAVIGSAVFATLVAWHYLADARIWRGAR